MQTTTSEISHELVEDKKIKAVSKSEEDAADLAYQGYCYEHGKENLVKDIKEAVRLYQLAAAEGNAFAQARLGNCYEHGRGVKQDMSRALPLYIKAAAQGDAFGQVCFGKCYEREEAIEEQDKKKNKEAVKYYRLAANQGYAQGQHALARCYDFGIGVEADDTQAVLLYQRAAEQGFAASQYALGCRYMTGNGVPQDIDQAVRLLNLAADQGHSPAYDCYIGNAVTLYPGQSARSTVSPAKAEEYFNKAKQYEEGAGVDKNMDQALEYYQSAADLGHPLAVQHLYFNENLDKGIALYKVAQENTSFDETNPAIKQNIVLAMQRYASAVAKANTAAEYLQACCYYPEDEKAAALHCQLAADRGNAAAQRSLGVCYQAGIGVKKDLKTAFAYFKLAVQHGDV